MLSQPLLILTALEIEARALAKALKLRQAGRGSYAGKGVVLRVIGPGAGHLPAQMEAARAVVLAGLGGGLDPALAVGEVVVDAADWTGHLPAGGRRGTICSAEAIVATVAQKAERFAQTRALAVDMESAAVRRWTKAKGLPLLVVRAISDTAGEALDPALAGLVDDRGRTRGRAVAGLLLRSPHRIKPLLRLGRVSAMALRRLGQVVADVANADCGTQNADCGTQNADSGMQNTE